MQSLKLLLSFTLCVGVFVSLNWKWGQVPSLGKVLNPFSGVWRNTPIPQHKQQKLNLKGLLQPVSVKVDTYGVPHVFAQNLHDLYFAQGYLVAKDRLWSMDLNSRIGLARISEMMGPMTVELDQYFIKMGFRTSARNHMLAINKDPVAQLAVTAYSDGVNAYIDGLLPIEYPPEYKITSSVPQKWAPSRAAGILNMLSYGLAAGSRDLALTRLLKKFDRKTMWDLFPYRSFEYSPIVPKKHKWNFQAQGVPQIPQDEFKSTIDDWPDYKSKSPTHANGSNNWALSGNKTVTGYSLLANDTHLAYSLPNIWYEMQLIAPDRNIYGAVFPAVPGIIIGFNKNMSWAVTNTGADVLDFYEVTFKDKRFSEYMFEGKWRKTRIEKEVIKVSGGKDITQEIVWTHQGILVRSKQLKGLILKWVVHQSLGQPLKAFLQLNQANNYADCKQSLEIYSYPAQNFICADKDNIGIWHQGVYPKKWFGQGRYVMDGSKEINDWHGWIPKEEIPIVENPQQGFVHSSNQSPADEAYPYYLAWRYDVPYRAQRVSEVLSQNKKFNWEDMQRLQYDDLDKFAQAMLPMLIKVSSTMILSAKQSLAIDKLKNWDYRMQLKSYAPTIFYVWWENLEKLIWEDDVGTEGFKPLRSRSLQLVQDVFLNKENAEKQNLFWLDDKSSQKVETLKVLVEQSFRNMWEDLNKKYGELGESWQWENYHQTHIVHLARIPGLGEKNISMGGSAYTVNANRGKHGAAWKMIVQLGPDFKAWTNYPGGQQGNPFDPKYTAFLNNWAKGEMRPVNFLDKNSDISDDSMISIELLPGEQ